jgi:Lon protease-like protein
MTEPSAPFEPAELTAMPVFPLPHAVFFPGTALPLHIFEPRYRAMIEDMNLEGEGPRSMAIALLSPGFEKDYEGRPPVHLIAGAGRVVDFQRRPDGRFDLVLYGVARVRLEELPAEGKPYRRAHATVIPDRIPHLDPVQKMIPDVLAAASSVASIIRKRHPTFEIGVDAHSPVVLFADRIADRLVADVERRQAILEQPDVKVRLALIHDSLLELLAALSKRDSIH